MALHEIITDRLVHYYWTEKWYGDFQGIVEYLGDMVREYSTPRDAKIVGIMAVITLALLVGIKSVNFMRQPRKGDTFWKRLFNKEDDE